MIESKQSTVHRAHILLPCHGFFDLRSKWKLHRYITKWWNGDPICADRGVRWDGDQLRCWRLLRGRCRIYDEGRELTLAHPYIYIYRDIYRNLSTVQDSSIWCCCMKFIVMSRLCFISAAGSWCLGDSGCPGKQCRSEYCLFHSQRAAFQVFSSSFFDKEFDLNNYVVYFTLEFGNEIPAGLGWSIYT